MLGNLSVEVDRHSEVTSARFSWMANRNARQYVPKHDNISHFHLADAFILGDTFLEKVGLGLASQSGGNWRLRAVLRVSTVKSRCGPSDLN